MAGHTVVVSVLANVNRFTRGFARIPGIAKLGIAGVIGAFALLKKAIPYARDLEQSIGAIDTVFKNSAETVHAWAATAASDLGITQNAYNESATLIGTLLTNMKVPADKLAGTTNQLITLGADLAATYGGTTADAVVALTSLLRGQSRPMTRYGVNIQKLDIKARMAALGLDKLKGKAGEQAKIQAILSLLTEQSSAAIGQFGREYNTLQGQQQRFQAGVEDLLTMFGMWFLPVATQVVEFLNTRIGPAWEDVWNVMEQHVMPAWESLVAFWENTFIPALRRIWDWVQNNRTWLEPLAVGIIAAVTAWRTFNGAIRTWTRVTTIAQGVWKALGVAFTANPIGIAITAIAALAAGLIWFFTQTEIGRELWEAFTKKLAEAWNWFAGGVTQWWEENRETFERIGSSIKTGAEIVGQATQQVAKEVETGLATIALETAGWAIENKDSLKEIGNQWNEIGGTIQDILIDASIDLVDFHLDLIEWDNQTTGILRKLGEAWELFALVMSIVFGVPSVEAPKNKGILETWRLDQNDKLQTVINKWELLGTGVRITLDAIREMLKGFTNFFQTFVDNIKRALDIVDIMRRMGADVISGFIQGVKDKILEAVNTARQVAQAFRSALKVAFGIASPSKVMRQEIAWNIMDGIIIGIGDKRANILSEIASLSRNITDTFNPSLGIDNSLDASVLAAGGRVYHVTIGSVETATEAAGSVWDEWAAELDRKLLTGA